MSNASRNNKTVSIKQNEGKASTKHNAHINERKWFFYALVEYPKAKQLESVMK